MHALLNENLVDDVVFVQELWFGHIGGASYTQVRKLWGALRIRSGLSITPVLLLTKKRKL